jgi:cell division protein FtsL
MLHISKESGGKSLRAKAQEEVSMLKVLLTMFAAIALVAAGSVASSASQTAANSHHKRITHHQHVAHSSSDITSFSSSAVLHVGVNRPPKNR